MIVPVPAIFQFGQAIDQVIHVIEVTYEIKQRALTERQELEN